MDNALSEKKFTSMYVCIIQHFPFKTKNVREGKQITSRLYCTFTATANNYSYYRQNSAQRSTGELIE